MHKLMVRISAKTFSIGYINCLPLCVYADSRAYDGIEHEKKKRNIMTNSLAHSINKINKSNFPSNEIYIQYLKWCSLYLNNLDSTDTTYRGEII